MKYDKLAEEQLETVQELGWIIHAIEGCKYVEIGNWSPMGEDIAILLNKENIREEIKRVYDEFDPDEHCKDLIKSDVKGLPKSVEALINDAHAIDEMLYDLYTAVCEVEDDFRERGLDYDT